MHNKKDKNYISGRYINRDPTSISIKLVDQSYIKEIVNDVLYYFPAKIIPAVVSFLALTMYTRLLTPNEYGMYIVTITSISFLTSTGFAWLNDASLRFWEEHKNRNSINNLVSNVIILFAILLVLIAIIWNIIIFFLEPYLNIRLLYLHRVGILLLSANAGYSLIITFLRARRKTLKFAFYSSFMSLGGTILAITLLYFFELEAEGIIFGLAIISAGIFFFELFNIYKKWGIKISAFSTNLLKKYASYGFPLVGLAFCSLILSSADRYMIAYFLDSVEVGVYSAGYSIAHGGISIIFIILSHASMPISIQIFENKGEKEISIFLTQIISIFLIFLIPASLGIAILSKDIVSLILPTSFQKATFIIPWIAAGVFCLGLNDIFLFPFKLKKKTLPILIFIIIAAVLNIVLNLALIPLLGISGAALTTLISYLIYLSLSWFFSNKILPFSFPLNSFWKSVVASGGMCVFLFTWNSVFYIKIIDLAIKILIAVIIYSSLLVILKENSVFKIINKVRKNFLNLG